MFFISCISKFFLAFVSLDTYEVLFASSYTRWYFYIFVIFSVYLIRSIGRSTTFRKMKYFILSLVKTYILKSNKRLNYRTFSHRFNFNIENSSQFCPLRSESLFFVHSVYFVLSLLQNTRIIIPRLKL